jgi:hypothetical protein
MVTASASSAAGWPPQNGPVRRERVRFATAELIEADASDPEITKRFWVSRMSANRTAHFGAP